jgi:hypothetical protein
MEAIFSSESSVETQRATRGHIPEDVTPFRFSQNIFYPPWIWRQYVPSKSRLKLKELHGVIFQNTFLLVGFRWTYVFHPEDRGDIFTRNVGWNWKGYTTSYARRRYCLSFFAELILFTLKMKAIFPSETSVENKRATRRHIPEDVTAFRFSLNLFLPPWIWRRYYPSKRRLNLNGLRGVIFQMTLLLVGFRWTYFFTLKMEAIFSSEMSVETHRLHGVIFQNTLLLVDIRWTRFFHPEDGGDDFLRIVGWNSTGYSASYSGRRFCLSVFAELMSSTLKMDAISSSETSVETQMPTPRNNPEDVSASRFSLNLFPPPWRWRR